MSHRSLLQYIDSGNTDLRQLDISSASLDVHSCGETHKDVGHSLYQ